MFFCHFLDVLVFCVYFNRDLVTGRNGLCGDGGVLSV